MSPPCSKYQFLLPRGVMHKVIEAGREFVARNGKAKLKEVAILHFGTTQQILDPTSEPHFI